MLAALPACHLPPDSSRSLSPPAPFLSSVSPPFVHWSFRRHGPWKLPCYCTSQAIPWPEARGTCLLGEIPGICNLRTERSAKSLSSQEHKLECIKFRSGGQPCSVPYEENGFLWRERMKPVARERYIQVSEGKISESIRVLACSYSRGPATVLLWVLVRQSGILVINLPFA